MFAEVFRFKRTGKFYDRQLSKVRNMDWSDTYETIRNLQESDNGFIYFFTGNYTDVNGNVIDATVPKLFGVS